jgi:hypothetical protein
MLCSSPITVSGLGVVGCGQCIPCRINKRREWVGRLTLEAGLYSDNAFVTLTYDDANLPYTVGPPVQGDTHHPTLYPKHLQDFLKRFRKKVASLYDLQVRFYAVGEYGDDTERPHFHLALFNYPSCIYGQTRPKANCCLYCNLVRETWGMGNVYLGTLEDTSMNYIAGYVLKKLTNKHDIRLNGRYPEFSRMSLRPGIGADAMHDVASTVLEFNLAESEGDVPSALRHGSRILPLGRYLRRTLRTIATGSPDAPEVSKEFYAEEYKRLQALQMASPSHKISISEVKRREDHGKVVNTIARNKLRKQRKTL